MGQNISDGKGETVIDRQKKRMVPMPGSGRMGKPFSQEILAPYRPSENPAVEAETER